MDGAIMNGKTIKVKQYNLQFGEKERFINILSCFKYKKNGNIYIIYSDIDQKYSLVYYGSGHLKENEALCMPCREKEEVEIIKEYIFKLLKKEPMDNFEIYSIDNVETIEIIGSEKLEVKTEILSNLIDIMIPKKELEKEKTKETKKKKNNPLKPLLIILIIIILIIGSSYFLLGGTPKDNTKTNIICTKTYQHETLNAKVEETNTYNFDLNDELQTIDTTMIYKFDKSSYQDFILKGTYYKYMPSSDTEGGWDKNDEEYTFKVVTKKRVDTSYTEPTNYEEALSYYKENGYTCEEKIME